MDKPNILDLSSIIRVTRVTYDDDMIYIFVRHEWQHNTKYNLTKL